MPCLDCGPNYTVSTKEIDRMRNAEALLCAITSVLQKKGMLSTTLTSVNWKEAGISIMVFDEWWAEHLKKDVARRKRENEQAERQRKIDAARSKLTPEERKLLGLK